MTEPTGFNGTPPPWYVVSAVEVDPSIIDGAPTRRIVHSVFKRVGPYALIADFKRLGDATLCAAAPDLLALLQELVDMEGPLPGTSEWGDRARAAIAQALGGGK